MGINNLESNTCIVYSGGGGGNLTCAPGSFLFQIIEITKLFKKNFKKLIFLFTYGKGTDKV